MNLQREGVIVIGGALRKNSLKDSFFGDTNVSAFINSDSRQKSEMSIADITWYIRKAGYENGTG